MRPQLLPRLAFGLLGLLAAFPAAAQDGACAFFNSRIPRVSQDSENISDDAQTGDNFGGALSRRLR